MDINEFREFGRAAIDFLADYLENIRDRLKRIFLKRLQILGLQFSLIYVFC